MTSLGTIDLTGSSTFTANPTFSSSRELGAFFTASTGSSFRLSDDPLIPDQITLAPAYRVVIVDMLGNQQMEFPAASLSPIKWTVNGKGDFSFTLNDNTPGILELQVPEREVQVWRGKKMLWWGVIIRGRTAGNQVTFQCQTLEWYFDRRLIGRLPRKGYFMGVHAEFSTYRWIRSHLPKTEPAMKPLAGLSSWHVLSDGNSLRLSPQGTSIEATYSGDDWFTTTDGATLTGGGKTAIETFMADTFGDDPEVTVNVYHDNVEDMKESRDITQNRWDAIVNWMQTVKPEVRAGGKGLGEKDPVATNSTPAGRTANRRIEIEYADPASAGLARSHGQYVYQQLEVQHSKKEDHRLKAVFRGWAYIDRFNAPAAHNYGLVILLIDPSKPHKDPKYAARGYKKVLKQRWVPISKGTPKARWIRMEASVMVPNDGKKYIVEGRLFPPSGRAYFDECDLFLDESLDYVDDEQAQILRDLVDHAQDKDLGKSNLHIKKNIRKTGVKRTRRYLYGEHTVIGDNLNEFTTLGDGVEWDIVCTPLTRTFTTYYPRKQRKTGYTLTLGQNIISADVDVDGTTTSNVVAVMANDVETWAREERAVRDTSLLEGVVMEMAYMATPGSSVSSLKPQAMRGIERYRKPVTVPTVVTNPHYTDEILQRVQTGDVLNVDVRTGWFQTIAEYRVLDMTLDPATEAISMTLQPEDTPVKVLSDWGTKWKYKHSAQSTSTGSNNEWPKATHPEYGARDYDDSAWSTGKTGIGWYNDGSSVHQDPDFAPVTTIPDFHEVWMRKTLRVTEEMYVTLRVDRFAYVYVNGNRVNGEAKVGLNFNDGFMTTRMRVPDEYLDPSGEQVVMIHVQDRLSDPATEPRALYADCKVWGIYNQNHVRP